jgi:hypothetical protein
MSRIPSLTKLVRDKLNIRYPDIVHPKEFYLSPKERISFKADIAIHPNDNELLIVEIEEKQSSPDTNVSKYWMYLQDHPEKKIKIIQVFGEIFHASPQGYHSRKELAGFIAGQMENIYKDRFSYKSIDLRYFPISYKSRLDTISDRVIKEIEELI